MTPYYEDDYATIYHGDCRDILPTLDKVDLVHHARTKDPNMRKRKSTRTQCSYCRYYHDAHRDTCRACSEWSNFEPSPEWEEDDRTRRPAGRQGLAVNCGASNCPAEQMGECGDPKNCKRSNRRQATEQEENKR